MSHSVIILDCFTVIEAHAFADNQLTSIVIPNSVTKIGVGAFAGNQLTDVVIPNSVTSIGEGAFRNNPISSITVGDNVTMHVNAFPFSFFDTYEAAGRKAGTYALTQDGDWVDGKRYTPDAGGWTGLC